MRTLYIDAFSGISGDMFLGALIDCGADFDFILSALNGLGISDEFHIEAARINRRGICGIDLNVRLNHGHSHHDGVSHSHAGYRNYSQIKSLILDSQISANVKERALRIFGRVAEAEAYVHGVTEDEVHFHEVGAVDSIVDIVGVSAALESLGIKKIVSSPLNLGGGTVTCDHGILPVPAPATARILFGCPCYGSDPKHGELTTPTGAACAMEAERFGELPLMVPEAAGYGFGKRDTGTLNALRIMMGEERDGSCGKPTDKKAGNVALIEANIDDMTGESLAFAAKKLMEESALDVWITPIIMKKGRPAHALSCMCELADKDRLVEVIFKHTTTWGLRIDVKTRTLVTRSTCVANTEYGPIRFKTDGVRIKAEYDDCEQTAQRNDVGLTEVEAALIRAARGASKHDK
jgi:uncharacterized protein (TIGR00299 family) protein